MDSFAGKRVAILGGGLSGKAAALLAKHRHCSVFLSEFKPEQEATELHEFCVEHGFTVEFGGHTSACLHADVLVVSPGIPKSHPVVQEAVKRGIPVRSEVEFAIADSQRTIVAITGTNGKTTTTALVTHGLHCAGVPAVACGNIGVPVATAVLESDPNAVLVVELSSYQLDYATFLRPDVALILNVTEDHVAYHGNFEAYRRAKMNIFAWQKSQDVLIYGADDPHSAPIAAQHILSTKWTFSTRGPQQEGAYINENALWLRVSGKEEEIMPVDSLSLPGLHNRYNSMAAALALRALNVSCQHIREALSTFQGVEHRLELVRVLRDVTFVNDSKATNMNAAWYALGSYPKGIVWLAGGKSSGNDYSELLDVVRERVSCVIAFGEDAENVFHAFAATTRVVKISSLLDAVAEAQKVAEPGQTVLLSPACKSFDEFANFVERGVAFRKAVASLS